LEYASIGLSVETVQEKPYEPPAQPVTVSSGAQLFVVVAGARQQKSVDPAFPAMPMLHSSVESESSGVSEPVHE